VRQDSGEGFIDWNWLRSQPVIKRQKYFTHTRLPHKLGVVMDGRQGIFLVYQNIEDSIVLESGEVEIDHAYGSFT